MEKTIFTIVFILCVIVSGQEKLKQVDNLYGG